MGLFDVALAPPPLQQEPPILISSGDSSKEEEPTREQQRIVVVDLSRSVDELPELNPQPAPPTTADAAIRQAVVLLERIDGRLPLPQFPVCPVTLPPPESEPEVDWNELEPNLAVWDQPPQFQQVAPIVPQPAPQLPPPIGWELIAYALLNLAQMKREWEGNGDN